MGNSLAGTCEVKRIEASDRDGWQAAATLPGLLDLSIVRAELARLRGPRPATELSPARASRSTVSGDS